MKNKMNEEQAKVVLEALDKALAEGPWESSNFLRVIGKNLRKIRDNFVQEVKLNEAIETPAKELSTKLPASHRGQKEIYIALYTQEGSVLQAWERLILNLPKQVVSRPIYAQEEDVKFLIKSKENKINEAYAAIYVNEDDILAMHPDKVSKDRFGKALLTLKDKAINLDNITRFVHISGVYHYKKGRLFIKT